MKFACISFLAIWFACPLFAASIPGLRITGPIVPTSTADSNATHVATYGKGGFRSVADVTARDAIPAPRRESGMLVWVEADGKTYQLGTNLTSWTEFAWHLQGGDVRAFGADPTGVADSTAAILAAAASAQSTKVSGSSVLYFPGGTYRLSQTLQITNQRVKIHGDAANASAFNNTKIIFTGTNSPILNLSGTKLDVEDLTLEYEYMQGPEATNSVAIQLQGVIASQFQNLSIRKCAYGIKDNPAVFQFQNSFRDIYIYSFSRAGIKFERQSTVSSFDNIYVQNASDGLETSVVNITATTVSGTNITYTLDRLPTRMQTNMMVTVSGLSPAGLNGLTFITNITGLDVSTAKMTAPGAVVDGVGTLEVTARYCAESPVDIGYGWVSIKGLDIEHCVVDDDSALAFRGELNELSDVHFEQIYSISSGFSFISCNAGSGVNIGSISIANLGFLPGTTNYLVWSGFQSARGDKGAPFSLGFLRARDVAKVGATWLPARKSNPNTYPDLLLLGGYDLEGEARPYGDARFTDENFGMSRPARIKDGVFSSSNSVETTMMLRPRIAQSGNATWTGIHISPTNSDLAFGSGGGYPFRYSAGGFDRFLLSENGSAIFIAGNSNSVGLSTVFRGNDQEHPSARVNILYGQTNNANRMNVGPNYVYVTDNLGANQPMYLQLLGSYVIAGSGASGSGIKVGGNGNVLIQNIQSLTTSYDPPSLADGESVQVTSAGLSAVGSTDQVLASLSSIGTNRFVISAIPTGNSNQVAVILLNASGSTVDLPSGTLRITVFDY
jgi:hypothetical protein